MSWDIMVGILWQFDSMANSLADSLPMPVMIGLGAISGAAGLWGCWMLGMKIYRQAVNALIATIILSSAAMLLGAGRPLWSWLLAIPVCSLSLLAGRSESFKVRWQARLMWVLSCTAMALLADNGAAGAVVISLLSWTVGWASKRMPLQHKPWEMPEKT
jgi:hypothetical protein